MILVLSINNFILSRPHLDTRTTRWFIKPWDNVAQIETVDNVDDELEHLFQTQEQFK